MHPGAPECAHRPSPFRWQPRWQLAPALVAVLASLVDVTTTYIALGAGSQELNPAAQLAMTILGGTGALLVGLVVRLGIAGGLAAIAVRGPRAARWCSIAVLVLVACWWVAIDVSNVRLLV